MHVLFVTGEYPPLQGGVGAYTAELARALALVDIRASVLTSQGVAKNHPSQPAEIDVCPVVKRWNWRIWRQIEVQANALGADWIHVQYQTAAFEMHPAINLAPRWLRRRGWRVAWTYHDLLVPYLFPKAGDRLRRWVTEQPATSADLVIVTNEGDRLQLDGRPDRLEKIPIGSNITATDWTHEQRTARRLLRGYSGSQWVIGYFGFLNRSKGGLDLVRTLAELARSDRDAHLLMIGERVGASDPTNFAYLQEVESLITELGLTERVQWTGAADARQSDEEVSADLNACDVLLMPYTDGASLRRGTLMAGLANGCAIVTTTPEFPLPELVEGKDLLYVAPGDTDAMAAAVASLVEDSDLRDKLRAGARRASRQFGWQAIAQAHKTLYATDLSRDVA